MSTPETGYLLVADVLGFSAMISNTPAARIEPRIEQWVSLVEHAKTRSAVSRCHLFSDTVFAATPSSEDGLRSLVSFARELLTTGAEQSFFVRGGIVHGAYSWGALTYGQAVIEAHKLEADQNWIGVACGVAFHTSTTCGAPTSWSTQRRGRKDSFKRNPLWCGRSRMRSDSSNFW